MAERTFSFVSNSKTFNIWADAPDITINVTGSTFRVNSMGALRLKGTCSAAFFPASISISTNIYDNSGTLTGDIVQAETAKLNSNTYGSTTPSAYSIAHQTSNYFNSGNPTVRELNFTSKVASCSVGNGSEYGTYSTGTPTILITNFKVTLNVPPTFDVSAMSFDTQYIYTGLTTASVTVSNSAAYYGGSIDSITLTIGNQTSTISGDGTLSILLDTIGTFTPTVTVTDSRGQTATQTLAPITVNGYTSPTVSFDAERTDSTGAPDDEGTYATLDATFTYTDVVADLIAPSVVVTDENGTQTTPTVTWYTTRASDGTLSNVLSDWSTVSYGDTVYGLVPNLSTQYSYTISVRPRDTQGTGTAILQTLAPAFYTVDFLAGGHGIAFGQPASQTGFYCNMDATFEQDLVAQDMSQQEVDDFVDGLNIIPNAQIVEDVMFTTASLTGNADHNIDVSSVISGAPRLLLVQGWTPASTWGTTLVIKQIVLASKTIRVRTIGTTSQAYGLRLCAIY